MTVTRMPGSSLYRQVFLVLRDRILQGVYEPRAVIPSEENLCSEFGVSRITVRRAVEDLGSHGLVQKRPGSGTFVSAEVPRVRASATLGFTEWLQRAATETHAEVIGVDTCEPPRDVAEQLELSAGAAAVHAVRLRSTDVAPVMITDAWVPEPIGRTITAAELEKRALYEILIAQGVQFGRVVQEFTAVAASPFHAKLLSTETGAPLIKLVRLLYDTERRPVQHLTVHASPERSRILMDVSIGDVNTLAGGSIVHR